MNKISNQNFILQRKVKIMKKIEGKGKLQNPKERKNPDLLGNIEKIT